MVSEGQELMSDFAAADLLICDVSAVANDWLVTGKPLLVTRVSASEALEATTGMLRVTPRMTAAEAPEAGPLAVEHIAHDPQRAERAAFVDYYLGETA